MREFGKFLLYLFAAIGVMGCLMAAFPPPKPKQPLIEKNLTIGTTEYIYPNKIYPDQRAFEKDKELFLRWICGKLNGDYNTGGTYSCL